MTDVIDLAEPERATCRVLAHYTRGIDSKNWAGLRGIAIGEHVSLGSDLSNYPYKGGLTHGEAGVTDFAAGVTGRLEGLFSSIDAIERYIGDLADFAAKS